ncbi:hypothetical protein L1049_007345 [Liquidambar formosana]|uniref:Gnk2-homologous domain-containing protein n=1 Tax=Liquidambar formosana TaxID=63359 RepID=A0AAP0N109_LIQFO
MPSFLVSALTLIFLFVLSSTEAAPTYLDHFCDNTTTFSPNSTYQTNRDLLLSSLSSNATGRDNGFYNTTVGRNPPDIAYGLFLCRGDVSTDVCQECVATASRETVQRCTRQKVIYIWYDECMLRYSNRSIFSTLTEVPGVSLLNTQNISDQDRFNRLLGETLRDLASLTGNDQTAGEKYATKTANFTALQTLYCLAQCTPDLTAYECNRCLTGAIANFPNCCGGKQGARVLLPSCNVRYELYPFYNATARATAPAPAPSLLPPPPAATTRGKGKFSSQKIIAIVVPIAVSVVLFFALCCCFLRWEAKKKYNAIIIQEDTVGNDITTAESLQFDLSTVQAATNNFSEENKIGEGGFGGVYKAWKHWTDGTPLELLDPTLKDSYSRIEVLRCIHIGLLCVQEDFADRPTMASVVLMLNSFSVSLQLPQQPAFFAQSRTGLDMPMKGLESDQSTSKSMPWSVNEASITELEPR